MKYEARINQKGVIPIIIIIAVVIVALAVLATIIKFSLSGSSKPSGDTSQSTSKPSSTAIAKASSSPFAEISDKEDACGSDCQSELSFDGEGDGVKASDLDGS